MEKNQIFENIMSRTSVRSYTDMPVEPEKVEMMLRAGMAAPSACNKQPWHFVVINDRTWRCMDSPLSPERTVRGNAATAASAQDDDSAQHPHHRISEESGGSKG